MATQPNDTPIGRYLAIAFAFVLVFVGVAYLAYRLTRGSGSATPAPTPTPSFQTGGGSSTPTSGTTTGSDISRYSYVLPAPVTPAIPDNQRLYIQPVTPNRPQVATANGMVIAQDGKGNLLFNNLTHEENYKLQSLAIEKQADLEKTREQGRQATAQRQNQLQQQQIQAQTAAGQRQAQLQQQQLQAQVAAAQRQAEQETTRQQIQAQIQQLTLEQQRYLAGLANERALKAQEQQNALLAKELQAKINQALLAQRQQQTLELLKAQAQINAGLAALAARYNIRIPYLPYSYATNFTSTATSTTAAPDTSSWSYGIPQNYRSLFTN